MLVGFHGFGRSFVASVSSSSFYTQAIEEKTRKADTAENPNVICLLKNKCVYTASAAEPLAYGILVLFRSPSLLTSSLEFKKIFRRRKTAIASEKEAMSEGEGKGGNRTACLA